MQRLTLLFDTEQRRAGDRGHDDLLQRRSRASFAFVISEHRGTGSAGSSRGPEDEHPPSCVPWGACREPAGQRIRAKRWSTHNPGPDVHPPP
jgi:hypothetical protein